MSEHPIAPPKSVDHLTNPIWSAANWHKRAEELFIKADRADTEIGRELLRRRARAAQSLADGMVQDLAQAEDLKPA